MFKGVLTTLLACLLLSGCGAMQQRIEGSPEEISRELREIPPLREGDWFRATMLNDDVHESSLLRQHDDFLEGGDATVYLSDLKKLEIFPLAGTSIPDHLLSDDGFELEVKKALRNRAYSLIEFTDGTVVRSKLDDPVLADDDRLEWSIQSVTPVSSLGGYKESRVVSRPLSSVRKMRVGNRMFYRFGPTDEDRLKIIEKAGVVGAGDWVRIHGRDGSLAEFQFRTLDGDKIVGGDGSVELSQVAEIQVYTSSDIAPTMGGAVAQGVAAAVIVPLIVIVPLAIPAAGGMPPMAP